jgi:hypothetical protein
VIVVEFTSKWDKAALGEIEQKAQIAREEAAVEVRANDGGPEDETAWQETAAAFDRCLKGNKLTIESADDAYHIVTEIRDAADVMIDAAEGNFDDERKLARKLAKALRTAADAIAKHFAL